MAWWLYPDPGRVFLKAPRPVVRPFSQGKKIVIGPFDTWPELEEWARLHPNYRGMSETAPSPRITHLIYSPWFLRMLWDLGSDGTDLTSDDIRELLELRTALGLDISRNWLGHF